MKYKVTCSDIEWDTEGSEIPKTFTFPKECSVIINAPDEPSARDWGMGDISDNNGFLIEACKIKIELIQEDKLNENDLANILHCIEKAYPCVVNGGPPPTFIALHDKISKLLK